MERLPTHDSFISEESSGMQEVITFYIFGKYKFDENTLNSLPGSLKTEVMNTFDVYYEKRIEKGRVEEKLTFVRSLLSEGEFTITKIARLAGVSEDFVRKVMSEKK